jgi:hypothetical protein
MRPICSASWIPAFAGMTNLETIPGFGEKNPCSLDRERPFHTVANFRNQELVPRHGGATAAGCHVVRDLSAELR